MRNASSLVQLSGPLQNLRCKLCFLMAAMPAVGLLGACEDRCQLSGHYCVGNVSAHNRPSCSMGCVFGRNTKDLDECIDTCCEAASSDSSCWYNFRGSWMALCSHCPTSDAVDYRECFSGCHHIFETGSSTLDLDEGTQGTSTVCLSTKEKTCVQRCREAGHCCHGFMSSHNYASCAQGCSFGQLARRVEKCSFGQLAW